MRQRVARRTRSITEASGQSGRPDVSCRWPWGVHSQWGNTRGGVGVRCARWSFFFFQAEDGIRDLTVTGVQTCALPISLRRADHRLGPGDGGRDRSADGADPRAPGGDGNRRDARYAQRLYGGRPDRHAVRGPHPSGRPRRRGPADRRPRGAAVHRGAAGMKRENEFAVGVVVIAALAVVVTGALWLSGAHLGRAEAVYTARFRTVGGLGVGDPVVLRGVRVGRVEAIRLAPGNWVEADLKIYSGVTPPAVPAVVAASASLFGEWAATLISRDPPPNDPNVRQALVEAQAAGGGKWPGATLPDIGQLTAQASRIATDIATVSSRIPSAVDSDAGLGLR